MITAVQHNNIKKLYNAICNDPSLEDHIWDNTLWCDTVVGYAIDHKLVDLKWSETNGKYGYPVSINDGRFLKGEDVVIDVYGIEFYPAIINDGNSLSDAEATNRLFELLQQDVAKIESVDEEEPVDATDDNEEEGVNCPKRVNDNKYQPEVKRVNPALDRYDIADRADSINIDKGTYEDIVTELNAALKKAIYNGTINIYVQSSVEYINQALQDYTDAGYNLYMNQAQTRLVFVLE